MEKMKLKDQVEMVLKVHPESRDCDITLMIKLWRQYYYDDYRELSGGNLSSLFRLPRESNISRFRRTFNEQGKYYPTKEEVARARNINITEWRRVLGYDSEDTDQMKMI